MINDDHGSCVCTALRQASRRVSQHYDGALRAVGISTNQYAILRRLQRCGPATVHGLAARLVMDRSTLGHLLRPLIERDLVAVAVAAADRRRREITLTPHGEAAIAQALPLWQAAQTAFEVAYGADAARQLCGELARAAAMPPTGPSHPPP